MKSKTTVVILILIVALFCGMLAVAGIVVYRTFVTPEATTRADQTEVTPEPAEDTDTADIAESESLPSVVQLIEFPDSITMYPADWPETARLPDMLHLVEVEQGTLEGNLTFSARYRAERTPALIRRVLLNWTEDLAWDVTVDTMEQGVPALILAEDPNGDGNCIFTLDVDLDEGTRVMLTLVIEE